MRAFMFTKQECQSIMGVIDKLEYVEHTKKDSAVCYLSPEDVVKCVEAGIFHKDDSGVNAFGKIITNPK